MILFILDPDAHKNSVLMAFELHAELVAENKLWPTFWK